MKYKILAVFTLAALTSCSFLNKGTDTPPSIYSFSNEITTEGLYNDLVVLSHDSLQGRETGTVGAEKAARYLADRYIEMGLTAVGDDDSYFQHFELVSPAVEQVNYQLTNTESGEPIENSTHSANDLSSFVTIYGGSDSLSGPIVFAGAGMMNEEEGVNQYPEDVAGKWLMVLYSRAHTNMNYLQSLVGGDALGTILLIGNDPDEFIEEAKNRQENFGQGRRLSLKYLQNTDSGPSAAFNRINPELGASILGLDSLGALSNYQEMLVQDSASFNAIELNYTLAHNPIVNNNTVVTKNVMGFLEGSDPDLKHEVVVLSSHYDHVGIGSPDSTGDNIYNGADDDGSGTVATLQAAQAMASAKAAGAGPKRSVLFLNVVGEEKGLLGSRYYSDHPIFSIENTVANINIDMIGRVDKEHIEDSSYVYIIGGEIISSSLDSLTQVANEMGPQIDLSDRYNDLNDPNQFYRRSDHWNFGRLGVPFVFFFNGVHEDYHRPSDEIEKITFEPFLKRTQLVYNLTAILGNSSERPLVDNQAFIEKTQSQSR